MNCQDFALLLDDYLDGELIAIESEACKIHLGSCPDCRGKEAKARSFIASAASLPRELQPSRDLWPEIAARIRNANVMRGEFGQKSQSHWLGWKGLAAAAAMLLFVTTALLIRSGRSSVGRDVAVFPSTDVVQAAMPLDITKARETFTRARQDLRTLLLARKADLDPKTMVVIEENLAVIDKAVENIEQALVKDPGNGNLVTLLVATYDQEIVLLQHVGGLGPRA